MAGLAGGFIRLLLGFPFQPAPVGEERNDATADQEHDAEHQHHTGVLRSPVLSLDQRMDTGGWRAFSQTDRSHGEVKMHVEFGDKLQVTRRALG